MRHCRSPLPATLVIVLSLLGSPAVVWATNHCVGDVATLIADIDSANGDPGTPATINLQAGCVYTFIQEDNFWYGPTALPAIVSEITIEGNGAVFVRDNSVSRLRFFYVAGDPTDFLPTGSLTLRNLTLQDGKALGGGGGGGGGESQTRTRWTEKWGLARASGLLCR